MSTLATRSPTGGLDWRASSHRGSGRGYRALSLPLALTDAVCLVATLLLSHALWYGWNRLGTDFLLVLLAATPLWILVFWAFGLYSTHRLSPPDEFARTLSAASLGTVLIVMTSFWWQSALSRAWVALTWVVAVLLEFGTRRVWRWAVWQLRTQGSLGMRTLVVGANEEARRLVDALATPGHGFSLVGYVSGPASERPLDELPWVGQIERLEDVIREHEVDCLFVASTALRPEEMLRVVQTARRGALEVRLSANLPELLTSRLSVQPIGPIMALSLRPVRLTGAQAAMKRFCDVALATLALATALPVLALVAAAVRLTSRGPVLFRQQRVTIDGRVFTMYKFRTMFQDAENYLSDDHPDLSIAFFKLQKDPRVTPVGRWLRKLSLDELPQLLNVLKGDMSLVGPRPLPVDQVAANHTLLSPRHEVRAGITGWWQINGRSHLPPEHAVQLDLFYIDNWSLALDLYILLKTIGAVFAQRGAY